MAFHNYEAVLAVQDAREQKASLEDEETTEIFLQQVQSLFGGKLSKEMLEQAKKQQQAKEAAEAQPIVRGPSARDKVEEDLIRVRKPDTKDK